MFFCIPLFFGFPKTIKPDKDAQSTLKTCPNCHNPSLVAVKSKRWFEFFFVRLVPLGRSKHMYMCRICHWKALRDDKHEGVQLAQPQGSVVADPGDRHIRPGYQPSYNQSLPSHPPDSKR